MPKSLTTDWMSIATSGPTVDGRKIEKQWLQDMAEHYSEGLYSAKLWPDHDRYYGAWGKVIELKVVDATEPELKGEIHLMAKLSPNDELIYLNRRGKYSHCSIEVEKNFRGKGYFYLGGLGITDEPASAGTSELHFSNSDTLRLPSVELAITDDREQQEEKSLFAKFKNFLNNDKGESQETAMSEKHFNQLIEGQNKLTESIATLVAKFSELAPPKTDEQGSGKGNGNDDAGKDFVSKKDYDELNEKFTKLDKKIADLEKTPGHFTQSEEDLGALEAEI